MVYRVFISHSFRDQDLAAKVGDFVRRSGAQVIDEALEADDQSARNITEGLRQSNEIILVVTRHSAMNPWLYWEIGRASALGKQITPVVEGIEPSDLPPPLNNLEAVRANSIEELREGLSERMASGASR